jgi:hypothetical protein
MKSPLRVPGTIFHPGFNSNVDPSPLRLLSVLTEGATTITAFQSSFRSAPFFASRKPQVVTAAQIPVDRAGIYQRLQVSRVELDVHIPKLKREHRAIDESCMVTGNNLLPSGLPFRLRSAKRRPVVLRGSPFRS